MTTLCDLVQNGLRWFLTLHRILKGAGIYSAHSDTILLEFVPMKIFLWLATLALIAVCFSCWAISGLIMKSLADTGRETDLPAFTVFLFHQNGWILCYGIPWIIYSSVLTFRKDLTVKATFLFAGTIVLGTALLVCAFFIASALPFLRMKAS